MALTAEKKKYEKELTDFITHKIKNVGGSLQFQHLNNLSHQLSFETKSAVASDKVQLMKFLRSHPKLFKIDSKGVVSIVENPPIADEEESKNESASSPKECSLPQCIESGAGVISRIHAEFGFIQGTEPFETKVYFRASAFGNEYSILTELHLETGTEVGFHAMKGHQESEAQYRADKVWLKDRQLNNKRQATEKELHGEGVIQKLSPEHGFISIDGNRKEPIFFSKIILPNHKNIDTLADEFKIGDHVVFTAMEKTGSKIKWEAISVRKLKKDGDFNECDEVEENAGQKTYSQSRKSRGAKQDMIQNVPGKISPHKNGTNILFGENYMQLANGDSSVYFLYGGEVSEISWEFSDGDDVHFDAVKIKEDPGWRAVLVWVGERPDYNVRSRIGGFNNEESSETDDLDHESNVSNRLDPDCFNGDIATNNLKTLSQNTNERRSRNSKDESESKRNRNRHSYESETSDFQNQNYVRHENEGQRFRDKDFDKNSKKKNSYSGNNQRAQVSDDRYFSSKRNLDDDLSQNKKNRKTGRNQFEKPFSKSNSNQGLDEYEDTSKKFLVPYEEDRVDSEPFRVHPDANKFQRVASIKLHESISCEITKVHCKLAYAKNPCLQNPVIFVSNAFYINGHSADDQAIDDLREVLIPGKMVNLNCFEIVDDYGKNHLKVTMAWFGEKPQISEMSPEDFISENDLSVTIDDQASIHESIVYEEEPIKFLQSTTESDSEDYFEATASVPKSPSVEKHSFLSKWIPEPQASPNMGRPQKTDNFEAPASVSRSSSIEEQSFLHNRSESKALPKTELRKKSVDLNVLSDLIINKLKNQGLLTTFQVDLDDLSSEIVDYICKKNERRNATACSQCGRTLGQIPNTVQDSASKEIQTIITGSIISQSIFTEL